MIKYFRFILFLLLIAFLFSCNKANNKTKLKPLGEVGDTINMKYAVWFQIVKYSNYKEVLVIDPWEENSYLAKYRVDDSIKNKNFALHSVSDIGYFRLLSNLEYIKGIADISLVYNEKILSQIENGFTENIGQSADVNKEVVLNLHPDYFIKPAFSNKNSFDDIFREAEIQVVYNIDWMEKHPLGRAEWIKFISVFTNQYDKADSIFNKIESNYLELKASVNKKNKMPDVIIGANYKGVWYMPAGNSYKSKILEDAGADYFYKNTINEGSLALNFENVLNEQIKAEFWLDVPYHTKSAMLAADSKYELFDAFKENNLYNNLKQSNKKGANEYWEYAMSRPDILLQDLIVILQSENPNEDSLYFYERLNE